MTHSALFITSWLLSLQVLFVTSALVLGRIADATAVVWFARWLWSRRKTQKSQAGH